MPLPADSGFCAFCGDPLPVPWVSFPCSGTIDCDTPDATTPIIALRDAVITPGVSASWVDPPGFALFGGLAGARWVAAAEPPSAIPAGALRFAALTADGGLPSRLLTLGAAGIEPFGKMSCGKSGCAITTVTAAVTLASASAPAAADPTKASRTAFAGALSAVEGTLWIAGGVDAAGNERHDLFAYYAVAATWTSISTRPLALGHVTALAWSATDRRLFALDEVNDTRRGTFLRLVSIAPDGSGGREEMRWRETRPSDVHVLAVDQLGHVWIGASRDLVANHTVGRLSRGLTGGWIVDGFVEDEGSLRRDGAYANERGLSVAVVAGPRTRIVGYAVADLHPHSGLEPWL
jgi:hypothetical protein